MHTHKPAASSRRLVAVAWVIGLVLSAVSTTGAQTLSVSGSPAALKITAAVAGSPPNAAVNAATTYTVKARRANQPRKITAQLDSPMPGGTTLMIDLTPVTTSTGAGPVNLTTAAQDLVVNITNTTNRTGAISYTFSATTAAGVVPSSTRTVTFTLLASP
ncbi:MAG: hypothetical protein ACHQWU_06470 [Gemmatimonadales bacterium]